MGTAIVQDLGFNKQIDYGFGYVIIRSPHTLIFCLLKGGYKCMSG